MTQSKIQNVQEAANELLLRIDDLSEACVYEAHFARWQAGEMERQGLKAGNHLNCSPWFADKGPRPSIVAAKSALRRQSMELTRALAEMRKP